ncbi:MAG TPA: CoA ester lyase [Beijerinckiaceae bacterium]|nr:CoA ester lyase [Beijerinckiaceae bacterium]
MTFRPRRSVLYMPGSNQRALEKAKTLAADVIIFDLEDAVAPDAKAAARAQVCAALRSGGYGRRELVVRVNAPDSEWGKDDIDAVAPAGPHAILIPKVASAEDILRAVRMIETAGAPTGARLWAMIETAQAVLDAPSIARTARDPASRLSVFILGTNDLAKETGVRQIPGRAPMQTWLSMVVAAARAHGVEVIDGVFGDIADAEGLRRECEQGRDFGMDGKTLIHPDQIVVCNQVFAPTPEEIAFARKIVAAFEQPENAKSGAIAISGRMIERLHADMARRMLALAEAIEAFGAS